MLLVQWIFVETAPLGKLHSRSVSFCLVFITPQHGWRPASPAWSTLDLCIHSVLYSSLQLFAFLWPLHAISTLLFLYFCCRMWSLIICISFVLFILWLCVWLAALQDEPLCPISRGPALSLTPLWLLLVLSSGSVHSHAFISDSWNTAVFTGPDTSLTVRQIRLCNGLQSCPIQRSLLIFV